MLFLCEKFSCYPFISDPQAMQSFIRTFQYDELDYPDTHMINYLKLMSVHKTA